MGLRLPSMLKDAGLTAFVAAALGIFIVGFRTYDVSGKGLSFDYQFTDLAIAVGTIFVGRLGLLLAAEGLRWPALVLGAVLGGIGAAPLALPSDFLHWFMALGGLLIIGRTLWPWARQKMSTAQHSSLGLALGRARRKIGDWAFVRRDDLRDWLGGCDGRSRL